MGTDPVRETTIDLYVDLVSPVSDDGKIRNNKCINGDKGMKVQMHVNNLVSYLKVHDYLNSQVVHRGNLVIEEPPP